MYSFTGSHCGSISMLGLMMYTRSKQPLYCSRIIDTRRTVFPEADGAQRMPFEGVLQTTGSRGCLTSKLWLGKSFTFPIFTPQRFEAFKAHLLCNEASPEAGLLLRVLPGLCQQLFGARIWRNAPSSHSSHQHCSRSVFTPRSFRMYSFTGSHCGSMSMEFDMMYTRSKQPRYCSRIIDTRRTVFPEADGAQRMPFEGVLQTAGSCGCLTVYSAVGKSFTFPIFTPECFEALEAHLLCNEAFPEAGLLLRVLPGLCQQPHRGHDAGQKQGGAEELSEGHRARAFSGRHFF